MKRFALAVLLLNILLLPVAVAQNQAAPHRSRHLRPRQLLSQLNSVPSSAASVVPSIPTSQGGDIVRTWDVGTYNGGAWVELSDVNDFGIAVGTGDIGTNETRTLLVPLFGPNAGQWTDLGSLGGQIFDWDEPLLGISNTGLVVTHSAVPDGHWHAAAWTQRSGLFDLHTLAELNPSLYPEYNSSMATGVNNSGTIAVGWSSVEYPCFNCSPSLPVVWTPSFQWKNNQFAVSWKMQTLDVTSFVNPYTGQTDLDRWYPLDVNDFGQIVGLVEGPDLIGCIPVLWNPSSHGRGWKLIELPMSGDYPCYLPFAINNRGEVVGAATAADGMSMIPALWKPLDQTRSSYSKPILLPTSADLPFGYVDGINELGEMSGILFGEAGFAATQAAHWSLKDLSTVQVLPFPSDNAEAWKINNLNIVIGNYTGGDCAGWLCGAAVQFRSAPKNQH